MTEAITATPGIRGVDGRQLPEVNREDFGPMPEMRQKTGTAKAIANPTTTRGPGEDDLDLVGLGHGLRS